MTTSTQATVTATSTATVEAPVTSPEAIAAASAVTNALWVGTQELPIEIASLILTLSHLVEDDDKRVGELIGQQWALIGGKVNGSAPTRLLIDACISLSMERKAISKLVNAAEIVSKQRVSQLLQIIIDGDKSANKSGAKPAAATAGPEGGAAESQGPLDSAPTGNLRTVTAADIPALIMSLPALTLEEAQAITKAIQAKLA